MVSNNEVMQTMGDLQQGFQNHDLSKFIQDMQQERTQHPQETTQYLAACNKVLEQSGALPGMQIEGVTTAGDRAIVKMPNGSEITVGKDLDKRPLLPGEKVDTAAQTTTETKTDTKTDAKVATTSDTSTDSKTITATTGDTPKPGADTQRPSGDTTYEVKKGDSLWRIAQHHLGEDATPGDVLKYVKAVAKANDMDDVNQIIRPNQKLTLPGDGKATAAQPDHVPPQTAAPIERRPPEQQQTAAPIERRPPEQQQVPPPGRIPSDATQQQLPPGRVQSDRTPPFYGPTERRSDSGDMQAQAAAATRREAVKILNEHMDDLFKVAAALPFDGKIPVGQLTALASSGVLGDRIDPRTLSMLQNVQSIEKHGNHIEITSNSDMRFALGVNDKGAVLDDVKVGHKLSFDLSQDAYGHNEFANVKGISVEGHTQSLGWLNHPFNADMENVTITKDSTGHTAFNAEFKNPERFYEKLGERLFKGVNRGEHITASIQLGDDGSVAVSDPNTMIKHRIG